VTTSEYRPVPLASFIMALHSFWAIELVPGKEFTTTPEFDIHVTTAVLPSNATGKGRTLVNVTYPEVDEEDNEKPGQSFTVASLKLDHNDSQQLDILFDADMPVTLSVTGNPVHLIGTLVPPEPDMYGDSDDDEDILSQEEDDEDIEDEDEEEAEADIQAQLQKKRPAAQQSNGAAAKKPKQEAAAPQKPQQQTPKQGGEQKKPQQQQQKTPQQQQQQKGQKPKKQ
jgi:hypothetical protein